MSTAITMYSATKKNVCYESHQNSAPETKIDTKSPRHLVRPKCVPKQLAAESPMPVASTPASGSSAGAARGASASGPASPAYMYSGVTAKLPQSCTTFVKLQLNRDDLVVPKLIRNCLPNLCTHLREIT